MSSKVMIKAFDCNVDVNSPSFDIAGPVNSLAHRGKRWPCRFHPRFLLLSTMSEESLKPMVSCKIRLLFATPGPVKEVMFFSRVDSVVAQNYPPKFS